MVRIGRIGKAAALALLGLCLGGCDEWAKAQARRAAEKAAPVMEPLTQSYASPNGLITVHYPADFAAKVVGQSGLVVSRNVADGQVEVLTFISADNPISTDVNEFSRVLNAGEVKELTDYSETSNTHKTCNGSPGIEIISKWKPDFSVTDYRRSCALVRNGHGYSFAYTVPDSLIATHRALLDSIIEATTFNR